MAKVKKKSQANKKSEVVDSDVTIPDISPKQAEDFKEKGSMELTPSQTQVIEDAGLIKTPEREAVLSIVGGVTTDELKKALEVQTEQRKLIQQFIKDNLVEDTDYGKIHVVKNCQAEERQRGSCDKSYHFSKSILFKPGQEKIFSLFGITDELVKDEDAYEMLQNVPGLVAYKCIMHRGDKRIGEGRGAATLAGSQSDPNSTIKKAEKRARMDACLSLGFSAYFTQDLDDPEYASQREMMNSKAAAEAERRDRDEFGLMPRDPELPIDNQERAVLHRIILKAGFSDPDEIMELLRANGIERPETMTSKQAREMMSKLTHATFAKPIESDPEPTDDEPVITDDEIAAVEQQPQPDPDPELVVDDELKNELLNRANMIGLNNRGNLWLMNKISGRPFTKWDKLNDDEWRRAYNIIQGIMDGEINVHDSYVAGLVSSDPDTEPTVDISEPTNQPDKDDKDLSEAVQQVFPGSTPIKSKTKGKGLA